MVRVAAEWWAVADILQSGGAELTACFNRLIQARGWNGSAGGGSD